MFKLDQIKLLELIWDPYDDTEGDDVHDSVRSGINVSKFVRALLEPLIASHFGETIPDLLFADYACLMSKHLEQEMSKSAFIIMSLKKLQQIYISASEQTSNDNNIRYLMGPIYESDSCCMARLLISVSDCVQLHCMCV